ncbi:MAG: hypothetical protein HOO91_10920 [Bacteroidales bacterium]|nr:hypothetical protein [Bacteroidales bacterium]
MKFTNPFRGVSGIALGVFLLIILSLSIYFFISIYKNERALQQRGFNVLNELSRAIKEQDLTLQRLGKNLISKESGKRIIKKNVDKIRIDKIINSYKDSLALRSNFFSRTTISSNISDNLLSFPITNLPDVGGKKYLQISYSAFLNSLLRKDLFSQYILIKRQSVKNETLVFNTFPFNIELTECSVYESINKSAPKQSLGSIQSNADSINSKFPVLQAGTVRQISIQGEEYEMFIVPLTFNNKEYYLGGFIEIKTYLGMKRGLDSTTVFIFILTLGIILFNFPLIKILLMGPFERLSRFGLSLGGISFVAGVIIAVILTTDAYIIFQSKNNIHNNLKSLSNSISDSFYKESESLLEQMSAYDSLITPTQGRTEKAILSNSKSKFFPQKTQNFKTFFWVDSTDNQIMQLSTRASEGSLSLLSDREYVKNYSKWSWEHTHKHNTLCLYNVEPIYSNTTGEWLLAFSTESKNWNKKAKLMAITSEMYSLKDPIIPDGYEYCLVDGSGKVWFHSKNTLYIKEDFIDACNQNQRLATAIRSGVGDLFKAKVHGKTYFLNVSALKNTQLYLVTMCDPFGIKLITVQACGFAFIALISVFIFLVLLYISIKVVDYKSSKLAGKSYFLSWIILNKHNERKYKGLIISNIFITLCLIIFSLGNIYQNFTPIHSVLISAIIIVSSFFFAFYNLRQNNDTVKRNLNRKIIYYSLLIFTLMIIDILGYFLNGVDINFSIIILSQLFLITVYLMVFNHLDFLLKFNPFKKIHPYTPFLFSWLVLAAIIPSFLIVKKTFKHEYSNYVTNQQISIAQQINARTEKTYKFYNKSLLVTDTSIINKRLQQGRYISFFENTCCKTDSRIIKPAENSDKSLELNIIFHLYFNKFLGEQDNLVVNPQVIPRVEKGTSSLSFNAFNSNDSRKKEEARFIITSTANFANFHPLKKEGFSLISWFLALVLIITIYFLLRYLSRKLFHFDIQDYKPYNFDDCLKLLDESKLSATIVNIHFDERAYAKSTADKFINISSSHIKIPELKANEPLFVIGFDSNLVYSNLFKAKISRLEMLLDINPPIRVIVMLHTDPQSLIDEYVGFWKISDDENYHQILIHSFEKVFSRLPVFHCMVFTEPRPMPHFGVYESTVQQELGFESHLMNLESIVYEYYDKERQNCGDSLILKIQELAQPYYTLLWNRLSFSERFVLFDLAQDGVVNVQNEKILKSLIGKGLIICDNGVTITSEGFKNFILTTADKKDLEERMKKIIVLGNWHRFKGPLIFVAASIFVFLIATQLSFLSNLTTILISVGSLLGVFLKFSGLFDTTGGK